MLTFTQLKTNLHTLPNKTASKTDQQFSGYRQLFIQKNTETAPKVKRQCQILPKS